MKANLNLLNKRLSPSLKSILGKLSSISEESGIKLYLVGGTVRDLILNRKTIDVDFLIDSGLDEFVESVESRLEVNVDKTSFLTAKFILEGFDVDIAQARKEIYQYPGALPDVSSAALEEDAKRRDFTINSLMLKIKNGMFIELIDYLEGFDDLRRGVIRVIHPKSFYDDPTRIIRAVRYKMRFNFTFDKQTFAQLKEAVAQDVFSTLSVQRLGAEFLRTLREENTARPIAMLWRLGMEYFLFQDIELTKEKTALLKKWDKLKKDSKLKYPWMLSLMIILKDASFNQINLIADTLELRKDQRKIITEFKDLNAVELLNSISKRLSKGEIYDKLNNFDLYAIVYLYLISRGKARKNLRLYIDGISKIALEITGEDVKKMGVSEGPYVGDVLSEVLRAKIEGKLKSKEEEVNYLKKLISKGDVDRLP